MKNRKAKESERMDGSHIEFTGNKVKNLLRQTGDKIMKNMRCLLSLLVVSAFAGNAAAKGAGTVGALTLLEPSGARPAALGEAFSAAENDIAAFGYNPASLNSLENGQASFMYQKGLAEDSYGHFAIGAPMKNGGFGLSIGYYNGGDFELTDENLNTKTVNAQTDMTVGLGYARQMGNISMGLTGKYLSSKLIDQYSATTFAADLGLQASMSPRLGIGIAAQNLGSKVTYLSEGDKLPTIYRAGLSYLMLPGRYATMLLLDAPYHANEGELRPAAGVEVKVGPMAIRGGYKRTDGLQNEFTVGAGFLMGSSAIDYSFGMVDQLSAEHRISASMKFGTSGVANSAIVRRPTTEVKTASRPKQVEERKSEVTFVQRQSLGSMENRPNFSASRSRQVYIVRPGDTLGKIAKRFYGDAKEWKKIYAANRHLLETTQNIEVGQKIVLP